MLDCLFLTDLYLFVDADSRTVDRSYLAFVLCYSLLFGFWLIVVVSSQNKALGITRRLTTNASYCIF